MFQFEAGSAVRMTLIEGVGDEVTIFFSVVFVLLILFFAWISTNVSDHNLISVIVVDSRSFQRLLHRLGSLTQRQLNLGPGNPVDQGQEAHENVREEEAPDNTQASDNQENIQSDSELQSAEPAGESEVATTDIEPVVSSETSCEVRDTSVESIDTSNKTHDSEAAVGQQPSQSELRPQTEDQLRQRRVAFFDKLQSSPPTECDPSLVQQNTTTTAPQHITNETKQAEPATHTDHTSHSTLPPSETTSPPSGDSEQSTENVGQGQRTEEVVCLAGHIRIRLKYLDERQRLVQAKPDETIGDFKRYFS